MKCIAKLYGGDAASVDQVEYGDEMSVELLDYAVILLMGEDYLRQLKKKNNRIHIKMSNMQYSNLRINNLSLLFTNYFNYDRVKLYKDNAKRNIATKATVSFKNKYVEIYTSIY